MYLSVSLQYFSSRTCLGPFPEKSCLDTLNIVGGKSNFLILLKGKWDKRLWRSCWVWNYQQYFKSTCDL